ncbi:MAG: hypothetical protein PVI30_22650 [Myxococcales bacterium]|jgi:hypothetical protein
MDRYSHPQTQPVHGLHGRPAHAQPTLSPRQAEALVEDRIEEFGLDVLPAVRVHTRPDGLWRVRWTHHEAVCEPMTRDEWIRWLEGHVGPMDPERLETSEG